MGTRNTTVGLRRSRMFRMQIFIPGTTHLPFFPNTFLLLFVVITFRLYLYISSLLHFFSLIDVRRDFFLFLFMCAFSVIPYRCFMIVLCRRVFRIVVFADNVGSSKISISSVNWIIRSDQVADDILRCMYTSFCILIVIIKVLIFSL